LQFPWGGCGDIVELRFFEKWDCGPISARLGLNDSTVRYHLHKCLKQPQPRLKD
jgi:DNA-directed RNA polymerase specialized sigma24 family protein